MAGTVRKTSARNRYRPKQTIEVSTASNAQKTKNRAKNFRYLWNLSAGRVVEFSATVSYYNARIHARESVARTQ